MKRNFTLAFGIALGVLFSQLVLELRASPSDIQGSPNVAVDSYRNSKGTYVLFANGRIVDASTGAATDLGNPYSAPAAGSNLVASMTAVSGKPLGSPNVALHAVPRPDATYVVFADGSLKKPSDANAGAGAASSGGRFAMVYFDGGSNEYINCSANRSNDIVFDTPFSQTPAAFFMGISDIYGQHFFMAPCTTTGLPLGNGLPGGMGYEPFPGFLLVFGN